MLLVEAEELIGALQMHFGVLSEVFEGDDFVGMTFAFVVVDESEQSIDFVVHRLDFTRDRVRWNCEPLRARTEH